MRKKRGWTNEPNRHALASKGIRTSYGKVQKFHKSDDEAPPKELCNINWFDLSPYDIKNSIKLFWWSSISNNWDWFEFKPFFKYSKDSLWKRLQLYIESILESMRGSGAGWNDDYEYIYEKIWDKEFDDFSQEHQDLIWDIIEGDRIEAKFMELFVKLDSVDDIDKLSQRRKIELSDNIVHLEHESGNVFNIDVKNLREEFEEEYL